MSEIYYNASNLIVSNGFVRNPERYYLEEFFLQKPEEKKKLVQAFTNDTATNPSNTAIKYLERAANKNFEIAGKNVHSGASSEFNDGCGVKIKSYSTSDKNDQIVIQPHTNTKQTAWNNVKWNTDNLVEWECAIKLPSNTEVIFYAGLKSWSETTGTDGTSVKLPVGTQKMENAGGDSNQAFFKFLLSDGISGCDGISNSLNLHFIYSIGNSHYSTDLGLKINASTIYRLKIVINKAKEVTVFVNEKQYSLTIQQFTTQGLTESNINQKSLPLASNKNMKPYIGIQGNAKELIVYYQKISVELS